MRKSESREVKEARKELGEVQKKVSSSGLARGLGLVVGAVLMVDPCRRLHLTHPLVNLHGRLAPQQLARAEEERDEAVSAKKALASQLSALESSRASDTLTRDIKAAQQDISKLKAKLHVAEEEGKTYRLRLEQLEGGAETVAVAQVNRQKKEFNEKLAKMEDKVSKLEEVCSLAVSLARWMMSDAPSTSRRTRSISPRSLKPPRLNMCAALEPAIIPGEA